MLMPKTGLISSGSSPPVESCRHRRARPADRPRRTRAMVCFDFVPISAAVSVSIRPVTPALRTPPERPSNSLAPGLAVCAIRPMFADAYEEFLVAIEPVMADGTMPSTLSAQRSAKSRIFSCAFSCNAGSRTMPPWSTSAFCSSNCGLIKRKDHTVGSYQVEGIRQDQSQRDKGNIDHAEIDRFRHVSRREVTRVHLLPNHDSRIVAEFSTRAGRDRRRSRKPWSHPVAAGNR